MMVKAALLPNLLRPGIYALGTVIISGAALIDACFLWNDVQDNGPKSVIAGALELDGFSVFFIILTCIALILAALFADGHLRREGMEGCEPYVLMLLSATGGIVMAWRAT